MALSLIPGHHLPAPGTCVSCGSAGLDMVDTGKNEDYYGALLICVACFRSGALGITELGLFDRELHTNIVTDLTEKIEWRKSLEPTVAKLELDLANALSSARRGFGQRYIADNSFDEVQFGTTGSPDAGSSAFVDPGEADTQLFFTIEELGLVDTSER